MSIIYSTDSYKISHWLQYDKNITAISAYIEPRKGPNRIVYLGLQGFLRKYLRKPITMADIAEAEVIINAHGFKGYFNRSDWEYIADVYGGRLPLEIQALPEGTIVEPGTPLIQVTNLGGKRTRWLTSYVETALLRAIWYPTTVATYSNQCRQTIKRAMLETCDNLDKLPFMLHDFGGRGVSSGESAAIGAMAHLVNFQGTDTLEGIIYAMDYYDESMAGFSIPAAEHSTITSWGRENEAAAYENLIDQFARPGSMVAAVSDSYNIFNAVDKIWGEQLKEKVIASGGTVVIRPDSGNPVDIVHTVVSLLANHYGTTTNKKGYHVLPSWIRVIQGDGIDRQMIADILAKLARNKFSADNIAFGMGGKLLQAHGRDDLGFAMKTSAVMKEGDLDWTAVGKDPVTDPGKRQKFGRLDDVRWRMVYRDGHVLEHETLKDIRQRVLTHDAI